MKNRKQNAFLFPGQGAQFVGMGREFYDSYSLAREVFEEAEDTLSFHLTKIIMEGPQEVLTEARFCQPALFVVSSAILKVIKHEFPDITIDMCGGLSLGEYSALAASGKASFDEVLRVVAKRGELMHQATLEEKTAMAAVLGLDEERIKEMGYYVANVNAPGQIVIAGKLEEMKKAEEDLKAAGARRVIPLDVAGAYHTPYMDQARDCLKPFIKELGIIANATKFVMNVVGSFVDDPVEIKENLIVQVSAPTRWLDCMHTLMEEKPDRYIEVGPSLLTGINRKFGVRDLSVNIEKIKDLENL